MLDYHLHLWPHSQSDAQTTVDQVAAYCERAVAQGVTEIAVTEHLFRFTQAKDRLGGFWDDLPGDELRPGMAAYWDHHARVDLDDYVEVVQAVKDAGLPVVLGLEVDYYQDRMDDVADLLHGYPFDVLLGSVHWLGTWRFDVLSDPQVLAEWDHRDIDAVWEEYTRAMEELGASGVCDVFAHPDLVKIAGRGPPSPTSSTTGSPRPPWPPAWPPRCPRPAGASPWGRSTRRRRCSAGSSTRASRSPRPRTPTRCPTWPSGPTTSGRCCRGRGVVTPGVPRTPTARDRCPVERRRRRAGGRRCVRTAGG